MDQSAKRARYLLQINRPSAKFVAADFDDVNYPFLIFHLSSQRYTVVTGDPIPNSPTASTILRDDGLNRSYVSMWTGWHPELHLIIRCSTKSGSNPSRTQPVPLNDNYSLEK